ncbi:MAG: MFS transporter [Lachnospiraceae bacterium]|nr:MFS transporter [Lachnospiraceae bacterium]
MKRNLIFLNVIISCIAASLLMTALNTALTPVCKDLGISVTTGQWLISGEVLAMGIVMPLTAFLIRRFPTKRLYLTGIFIFIVGLLIAMLSTVFPVMMCGRILQGCGNGILVSMAQVVILSIFPDEKKGSVMGWACG